MLYVPNIPSHLNNIYFEYVVKTFADALKYDINVNPIGLQWLDAIYPMAEEHDGALRGYVQGREYIGIQPDDTFRGMVYFLPKDPLLRIAGDSWQFDLDVVFFVNLDKIVSNGQPTGRYHAILMEEAISVIDRLVWGFTHELQEARVLNNAEIFAELDNVDPKYLLAPYASFRLNYQIQINAACVEPTAVDESGLCLPVFPAFAGCLNPSGNLPILNPTQLLGRPSDAVPGVPVPIDLGAGLVMNGNVLSVNFPPPYQPPTYTGPILLGRVTDTGAPETITLGTNLSFSGNTLNAASGSNPLSILQNGNAFGPNPVRIGATDNFGFQLITNNVVRLESSNDGRFGIGTAPVVNTRLVVQGTGSTSGTTALLVQNTSAQETLRVRDNRTILATDDTGRAFETFGGGRVDFGVNRLIQLYGATGAIVAQNSTSTRNIQLNPSTFQLVIQAVGVGSAIVSSDSSGNLFFSSDLGRYITFTRTTSQVVVGANNNTTTRSALEIVSNSRGFLPPRLTTAQRDAVTWTAADAGMIIYNITTNKHQGYNGTTWNDLY